MRINRNQEFVIGGYTPSARNFDALIFGYYEEGRLLYAGRTRSGFTPAIREKAFKQLRAVGDSTGAVNDVNRAEDLSVFRFRSDSLLWEPPHEPVSVN